MLPLASDAPAPPRACAGCSGPGLDFPFTMAFQPIVDLAAGRVYAQEALVRGPAGESAASVLARVTDANRYRFDQECRATAIRLASGLGLDARLSINFLPNAIYRPENCIRSTLQAAREYAFPPERIIFEIAESERVDPGHLREIVECYRGHGFLTAIDDFGAGYAGLGLLSDFRTDLVKLDMKLVRGLDADPTRRAIVRGIVSVCAELGVQVIAEGVETAGEAWAVRDLGIHLVQGYYYSRPALEALPGWTPGAGSLP